MSRGHKVRPGMSAKTSTFIHELRLKTKMCLAQTLRIGPQNLQRVFGRVFETLETHERISKLSARSKASCGKRAK